jgi:hypothetical protein
MYRRSVLLTADSLVCHTSCAACGNAYVWWYYACSNLAGLFCSKHSHHTGAPRCAALRTRTVGSSTWPWALLSGLGLAVDATGSVCCVLPPGTLADPKVRLGWKEVWMLRRYPHRHTHTLPQLTRMLSVNTPRVAHSFTHCAVCRLVSWCRSASSSKLLRAIMSGS